MSDRLTDLAQRKAELLAQSNQLRENIAAYSTELESRLIGVDNAILAVKRVVTNPLVVAGGALAVFLVGPRKLLRLAGRAFLFFSTARRIWRTLH